eukprot:CAMPEP_0197449194 /NCGR_PEP_ID=MMETSP1175-20131217/20319_1 /TAXON_ID=1003142 /ORGANISM="Triceratium dubium, Strain CCMP147" /LENGTH=360 /DNA_ID=CAMNT_0042981227 /DNA_START=29 /DNA_END=1108 /DNA_ORIENTATION=-
MAFVPDDVDGYIETLRSGECISERSLKRLCTAVSELLVEESNVQPVRSPVTIVGDLHGQFYDLLNLFSPAVGGSPPQTSYVFLGDFVDRGHNSVETLSLLLCLKIKYPGHVTLLRGNHESRQITQVYGFYDECLRKYGNASAWRHCVRCFDAFALAAVIDSRVLCVHGGLSPDVRTVDQIRAIDRQQEIPHEGAFCDLVWSDPEDIATPWQVSPRGAGYLFGARVTDEFCFVNRLDLIARAHQLVMEGRRYHFPNRNLVTVWSAPNYCYRCGNVAAILTVGGEATGDEGVEGGETGVGIEEAGGEMPVGNEEPGIGGAAAGTGMNGNDPLRQSFRFFHETEHSVHGPKGEERAQLVPYFL